MPSVDEQEAHRLEETRLAEEKRKTEAEAATAAAERAALRGAGGALAAERSRRAKHSAVDQLAAVRRRRLRHRRGASPRAGALPLVLSLSAGGGQPRAINPRRRSHRHRHRRRHGDQRRCASRCHGGGERVELQEVQKVASDFKKRCLCGVG